MTPEEQQLLTGLFDQIQKTASQSHNPPDSQALAYINDAVRKTPLAPYLLAQTVLVQGQALQAANAKIQQLEAQAPRSAAPAQSGGFLSSIGSLFGAGQPPQQQQSPQQQAYRNPPPSPPPQAAGPWGAAPTAGGGFLKNALGTAAGVAGGVMLANSLQNLFSGGHAGAGQGGGFLPSSGETIVNNYYGDQNDAPTDSDYAGGANSSNYSSGSDYPSDSDYASDNGSDMAGDLSDSDFS